MPSTRSVQWSPSTTLGVTLLGLSAALLAVDIGGTFALDNERAPREQPAAPAFAAATPAAIPTPRTVAAAVITRAPGSGPQRGAPARRRADGIQQGAGVRVHVARTPPARRATSVLRVHDALTEPARIAPFRALVYVAPPAVIPPRAQRSTESSPAHASAQHAVPTLRDIRRFVMRELNRRDKHVCVISSMTFALPERHVVVDLIYRDGKGRWSEKAVVRRGGSEIKLIGVKLRPLPEKTVAVAPPDPGP